MPITAPGMKVRLIELDSTMSERLAELGNDIEVSMYSASDENFPFPYNEGDAMAFIEDAGIERSLGIGMHYAISTLDNVIIGAGGLGKMGGDSHAEMGYWLGRRYWGRGYGTDTAKLLLHIGFLAPGIDRIDCIVPVENERSYSLLERIGMLRGSTIKDGIFSAGRSMDCYVYYMLKKDFSKEFDIGYSSPIS